MIDKPEPPRFQNRLGIHLDGPAAGTWRCHSASSQAQARPNLQEGMPAARRGYRQPRQTVRTHGWTRLIVVDVNVLNYACPLLLGVQKLKKLCATLFAMFMASFAQSQELADLPLIDADGYQAGILRLPGNFLARDECVVGAFVICGPFSVQGLPDDFRFYLAGASESAGAPGYGGQSVNTAADNQDHGNDRGSATSIGLSSTTEGQLHVGDNDYFRIDITEPVTIRLETTGSADTYGQLYRSDGALLRASDDDGMGKNFRLAAALEAGTYYLLVGGYNDSTAGQYTLAVSGNLAGGQSFDTATKIGIPSSTRGEINSGERDIFRVDLVEAGNLRIRSEGRIDTYGAIYDSAGNVVAENDDADGDERDRDNFSMQVNLDAGTYYIEVRGFDNSTTGSYTLGLLGSWNISDPLTVLRPVGANPPKRVVVEWPCSKDFTGAVIEVPFLPRDYADNFSRFVFRGDNFPTDAIAVNAGCNSRSASIISRPFSQTERLFRVDGTDRTDLEGGSVTTHANKENRFFGWDGHGAIEMISIGDWNAIRFDNQNESREIIQEVFSYTIVEVEEGGIFRDAKTLSEGEITVRWLPRVK